MTLKDIVNARWHKHLYISRYYPLILNHGHGIEAFDYACPTCKRYVGDALRGDIDPHPYDDSMKIARFVGYCQPCKQLSTAKILVVPDGKRSYKLIDIGDPKLSPWPEDNKTERGGFGTGKRNIEGLVQGRIRSAGDHHISGSYLCELEHSGERELTAEDVVNYFVGNHGPSGPPGASGPAGCQPIIDDCDTCSI